MSDLPKNTENETEKDQVQTSSSFSFVEMEKDILHFWQEKKIFEKSLEQTKNNTPYIFYDGPPFATGLPHHGHLVSSTLKDIVPRYFTMKGRHVSRRFGWDCHGLPIEQEIDKKFGISAHEYVKKNGIKSYNDECRSIVLRYTKEWEKTISRLGRWVDFKNDYKTMDISFMESIWWVFKQLWDKGLIYKGTKVVPFSTAFGTVLSNFEASDNYQDVQDPSITIMFKMKDQVNGEDCYLSAWTTTPWTLPSNLGLCVNEGIEYHLVFDQEKKIQFYLAVDRFDHYAKKNKLEIRQTTKGKDLLGKRYVPLFPYFKDLAKEGCFQVLSDEYVTTADGTGIVHLAPAFGEDDHRVMASAGIKEVVCPIDEMGKFTAEVPDYAGQYIKDTDKTIMRRLKDEGKLYDQGTIVHAYPFCPRTDTPLIYRAISSWYVNVVKIKEDLIRSNQEITWVPAHIKDGRFGKWLEGARDWAISRNRVWGTPLPIWENSTTGNFYCIGSIDELHKLSGVRPHDLHRENVDNLTFKIEGEEGEYKRITDVLDCWFESGSMPYSQLHYPFENKQLFENNFPAEYIAEGLDQTRGWFYTLTVLSSALFKKPAFRNVIVNGMVLAGDGKKMSKRLRNYTPPDDLMEKFGADALRLFLINSGLVRAEELRFTDDGVKDMVRRALLPWYNSFKFFQTYAEIDGWNPQEHLVYGDNILDRWVLSKLQTLIKNVNHEMEHYRLYNVVPELFDFIEDLTNWYIRLNRRRFWGEGLSADKKAAYSALYTTMRDISVLMAPFAPFLSDHIFLQLKKFGGLKEESIHLMKYPEAQEKLINPTLEDAVGRMAQIILLGRQKRIQEQVKVKTPLKTLTMIHKDKVILNELKQLEDFIKIELNVKNIAYSGNESAFINLYAKPNSPVLGKRLGKDFAKYRQLLEALKSEDVEKLEAGETLNIAGQNFTAADVLIFRDAKEKDKFVLSNRFITIRLDCTLDQDLIDEGLAREIVNRIQKTRKDAGFHVADRITICASGDTQLMQVMKKHQAYILGETLGESLTVKDTLSDFVEYDIENLTVKMHLQKIS